MARRGWLRMMRRAVALEAVAVLGAAGLLSGGPGAAAAAPPPPPETAAPTVMTLPAPYTAPTSFDISWVDPATGMYLLSDRTNGGVDEFNPATGAFVRVIGAGQFVGNTGNPNTSGPNGVLTVDNVPYNGATVDEVWAADGNSVVRVYDLATGHLLFTVPTGGNARADEMAYDPTDGVILVANDADTPAPFISFIDVRTGTVIQKIVYNGATSSGSLTVPNATDGIEQSVWDPADSAFYINIPQVDNQSSPWTGEVDKYQLVSGTWTLVKQYAVQKCSPGGLALGPNDNLLLGCSGDAPKAGAPYESVILNAATGAQTVLPQVGGSDEVWYDPVSNDYYLAAGNMKTNGAATPVLGVVDAATGAWLGNVATGPSDHSVAGYQNEAVMPLKGQGIGLFPFQGLTQTFSMATAPHGASGSFDISWVDPATGMYLLADRTNAGVDEFNPQTGSLAQVIGQGQFVGNSGNFNTSGPNGVLTVDNVVYNGATVDEVWAGDGNSTVRVFNLATGQALFSVPTGGTARADEMAYDPTAGVVAVANDADSPPFLSFISVGSGTVTQAVYYNGTAQPAGAIPLATDGIEQSLWDPADSAFYVNIPQVSNKTSPWTGEVDKFQLVSGTWTLVKQYPVLNCSPGGLALGPHDNLLLGCSGDAPKAGAPYESVILNAATGTQTVLPQVGGSDEVWYDPTSNDYYLAAGNMATNGTGTPVLAVVDAATNTWLGSVATAPAAHSVAAYGGAALVPLKGTGIGVVQLMGPTAPGLTSTGAVTAASSIMTFPAPYKAPTSFDISWVDPATGMYLLADRTNAGVDEFNPATGALVRVIGAGQFVGNTGNPNTSGPNGVLTVDNVVYNGSTIDEVWAGDGNSTVRVFNLATGQALFSVPTGGTARADEMAYDPLDGVVVLANDADSPPFLSFIDVHTGRILEKIVYGGSQQSGSLTVPNATDGIEQSLWDPAARAFYVNIPQVSNKTSPWTGEVDEYQLVSGTWTLVKQYPVPNCSPGGLALGPNDNLLLGCSGDAPNAGAPYESVILDPSTGAQVTLGQVGGSDEVWYDGSSQVYFLAASNMKTNGKSTPVLGVVNASTNAWLGNIATAAAAHSVAAYGDEALVPLKGVGIGVFRIMGSAGGGLSAPDAATSAPVVMTPPVAPQSFDISWVDPATGMYLLADRTTAGVDEYNPATGGLVRVIGAGQFVGNTGNFNTSGPNGVLTVDNVVYNGSTIDEVWAGDGNSTVRVFNLATGQALFSVPTGGTARADEMAYDPTGGVVVVANDADSPPFLSFIDVHTGRVLEKITYGGSQHSGSLTVPNATDGIEQSLWDAADSAFFVNIPQVGNQTSPWTGEVDEYQMAGGTWTLVKQYPVKDCSPGGLALGPNDNLLLGCSGDAPKAGAPYETVILNVASGAQTVLPQVGGSDEVWYDPANQEYFLAAGNMVTNGGGTPVLGVVNAVNDAWLGNVSTGVSDHSVAAYQNQALMPLKGSGIGVFALPGSQPAIPTIPVTTTTTPSGGAVGGGGGGTGGGVSAFAPVVSGVQPDSGSPAGGTSVTITGARFTGATAVDFGTTAATAFTVDSDTQITATSPAGTGAVDVTVTSSYGISRTSYADQFTYQQPVPTAGQAPSAPTSPTPFSDVPSGFWAASYIAQLQQAGIVSGFPNGTFQPDADVTRAEFVKMLDLTLGLRPVASGATAFTDVPASSWYAPYVAAAARAGLVQGLTAKTFGPGDDVSRQEMAVLVARALKLTRTAKLSFKDDAQIAPWATGSVEEVVAAGYMNGFPDGTFQPAAAVTRAQASKVLAMILSARGSSGS